MSIQNEIDRIEFAKENIANALGDLGVTIPIGTSLSAFPDYISAIVLGMDSADYDANSAVKNAGGIAAYGNANYEPKITVGTSTQYWRGDKTWAALNKEAIGLSNVDNIRQYSSSNPPPYPVTSVNGQTGEVTISSYTLPIASSLTLGGIKVGEGLSIDSNGVLSSDGGQGASTKEVITLPITGWSGTTAPYTKTVTLNGITANDYPIIDLISSASYDTAMYEEQSWGEVYRIIPSTNSLTFYSQSIPVVPLDLQVQYLKNATSSESVIYTTTLNTTWTGSSAPYTKTQTVSGILATDTPIIDIVPSSTYATAIKEEEFWVDIYRVVVASNRLTFYAKEKPTVALKLKIQCIRSN